MRSITPVVTMVPTAHAIMAVGYNRWYVVDQKWPDTCHLFCECLAAGTRNNYDGQDDIIEMLRVRMAKEVISDFLMPGKLVALRK